MALVIPATGSAASCVDPGPIGTSITNDAAIEVHALRRETADNCAAELAALGRVQDRLDLGWWGTWAVVGVLLGGMAGFALNSAFRFWGGDE